MPNARLTMMNKAANDIAPTFDAAQAACNVACTIAGSATQIFRGPDALALHLRPAKYCFAISLDVALYSTQKLPNAHQPRLKPYDNGVESERGASATPSCESHIYVR
jgi:hypothetical protein